MCKVNVLIMRVKKSDPRGLWLVCERDYDGIRAGDGGFDE